VPHCTPLMRAWEFPLHFNNRRYSLRHVIFVDFLNRYPKTSSIQIVWTFVHTMLLAMQNINWHFCRLRCVVWVLRELESLDLHFNNTRYIPQKIWDFLNLSKKFYPKVHLLDSLNFSVYTMLLAMRINKWHCVACVLWLWERLKVASTFQYQEIFLETRKFCWLVEAIT